jgi:hypothetical protein
MDGKEKEIRKGFQKRRGQADNLDLTLNCSLN